MHNLYSSGHFDMGTYCKYTLNYIYTYRHLDNTVYILHVHTFHSLNKSEIQFDLVFVDNMFRLKKSDKHFQFRFIDNDLDMCKNIRDN